MNHPEEAPKLSTLPFIIGDLALIAAAAVIATRSPAPIGPLPLLAITICVVFGAALLVVPFLANYARRQHAELDDRQHQIAALARTTAESAEQLSIAAAGLHGIAQSSKENLEALEKLPAVIQERIAGISQPLAGSSISPHGALKGELAQLEASVEKISRSLAKLDAATKSKADALAAHEQEFSAILNRASTRIEALVAGATAQLTRVNNPPPPSADEPETRPKTSSKIKSRPSAPQAAAQPEPAPASPAPSDSVEAVAPVPPPAPEPATPTPTATPSAVAPAEVAPASPPPSPELTPSPASASENSAFTAAEPDHTEVPVDEPAPARPPRARKAKSADEEAFDLGLVSDAQGVAETAVTSDGFTRLIATAYIGIGNRLFIRGEGPGLSWEKGVPLQFVSIGKWRWETPDASAPISAKLYKNDQVECLGLGKLTLQPGHQHEVNAGF